MAAGAATTRTHVLTWKSPAASPSSRPSVSIGCSPSATPTTIPTCCRTSTLQKNVDMTRDLGFVKSALDVKQHTDRPEHRRSGGEAAEIRAEATRLQGSYAETVSAVLVTATPLFPSPTAKLW